ncbi:DEAD/DEAH box helicase [Vibrio breoganii]
MNLKETKTSTSAKVIGGVTDASLAITASKLHTNKSTLIICKDNTSLQEVTEQISFFGGIDKHNILEFKELETLPYDIESPHEELTASRIKTIQRILQPSTENLVVATTPISASQLIMDIEFWTNYKAEFKTGHIFETCESTQSMSAYVTENLGRLGYVDAKNEIRNRNSFVVTKNILEIFSSTASNPVRIIFNEDNVIESIYSFSASTQKNINKLTSVEVYSAREVPNSSEYTSVFRTNYRKQFLNAIREPMYQSVSKGFLPDGIEFYTSLFLEKPETLLSIATKKGFEVILAESAIDTYNTKYNYINTRYSELSLDSTRRILEPNQVWLDESQFLETLKQADLTILQKSYRGTIHNEKITANNLTKSHKLSEMLKQIRPWVEQAEQVIFTLKTDIRLDQLNVIASLLGLESPLKEAKSWEDIKNIGSNAVLTYANLHKGYFDKKSKTLLLTEQEIFGAAIFAKSDKLEDVVATNPHAFLKDLEDGDLVVHRNYGLGRFRGLRKPEGVDKQTYRAKSSSRTTKAVLQKTEVAALKELFVIEYAKGIQTYIPQHQLHLINKYDGIELDDVTLSDFSQGESKWKQQLSDVIDGVEELSHNLISQANQRENIKGVKIDAISKQYFMFCKEFPYEPTQDQLRASAAILEDLRADKPMDRLVAGDVGFGKTEVALRAAMATVLGGFQVVMIVPSTILSSQHYESFKERFESFNINVVELSGSQSAKQNKDIIADINTGKAQIVIGTTKTIKANVAFHNLGLTIIDEEHRFGVKDKDTLHKRFEGINLLSMTATPIPRTLRSSLMGIKDTSTLSTPPAKRLSIRTRVELPNDILMKEAIEREQMRDGQGFVLHNDISTIQQRCDDLQKRYPSVRFSVLHGKMSAKMTEDIMAKFFNHEIDWLVATTIIETGIDVPNANTMIVDNADQFGMASLHQIRGRVGRSTRQGYCNLLKSSNILNKDAELRLHALLNASRLGDGYKLALTDMEIRGAGELLGTKQSKNIPKIGYTLYHEILDDCMKLLKEGENRPLTEGQKLQLKDGLSNVQVDLELDEGIPASYVPFDGVRSYFYRSLASAKTLEAVDSISEELEQRFGALPEKAIYFIEGAKLRVRALGKRIKHLSYRSSSFHIITYDEAGDTHHIIHEAPDTSPNAKISFANQLIG